MTIDFHTHAFPQQIARRTVDKLQSASHTLAFSDGSADGLRRSMAGSGIDLSVVLPVATNPEKLTTINDLSIHHGPADGLCYFGSVHPLAPNWDEELRRIAAGGVRGIKIHPVYQGVDIDDIRYVRLLGRAAELGLIVVMHAGDDIGFPGVVRCSPEMTARALKQVPGITIVLAHMGGWKNWDRVTDHLADTGCYLDTAFSLGAMTPCPAGYYTNEELALLDKEHFCKIVRDFGGERVLFGTDSPWSDQKQSKEDILALPLTDAEKSAILGENAKRLLGV